MKLGTLPLLVLALAQTAGYSVDHVTQGCYRQIC